METFLEELRRYMRFGDADEDALRAFLPVAKPSFEAITDEFYERLLDHPEAANVFRNEAQVLRLKATLCDWLERLLGGPWDEDYFELRSRIGRVHVKIRLPQRYMLTAMGVIEENLLGLARRHHAPRFRREATEAAIVKILSIELAIMLEIYRDDTVAALRRYERAERDLLARRLELTEARYHAIFEHAPAIIAAVDHEGQVVLFNRRAEDLSEVPRADILGQNLVTSLCHPHDRDALSAAIAAGLAGAEPEPLEVRFLTARGDERWLRIQVQFLDAIEGALACVLGVDVTGERELAARSKRVETLASLGTLAAGLAHEIRNPLNAAQLQLVLVERRLQRLEDGSGESALAPARLVREELHRLGGLVSDFLAFARPIELRVGAADLGRTIESVLALLEPTASEAGVTVTIEASEPVVAMVDEERVKQVLFNLVRNGIEAAGDGGSLALRCSRVGTSAVVEVRDSGPGVADGVQIFEPFTTTKEAGTGLGLPIVHRIVSDHGGDIDHHRDGDETVFRVELPIDGPT